MLILRCEAAQEEEIPYQNAALALCGQRRS
jgi:hypothetical protein